MLIDDFLINHDFKINKMINHIESLNEISNEQYLLNLISKKINIQSERLKIENKEIIVVNEIEKINVDKNKIYFIFFEFYENIFYWLEFIEENELVEVKQFNIRILLSFVH
jgi:hypothetical protein